MIDDTSDDDLLARIEEGELDAFEALYARHCDSVYRLAVVRLGTSEWRDQAVRDTWAQLHQGRLHAPAGTALRLSLLRGVRIQVFEQLRQHQHLLDVDPTQVQVQGRDMLDLLADATTEGKPGVEGQNPEQLRFLELPGEWRELLVLSVIEGLDLSEIGVVTGLSARTIEDRLDAAAQALGAPRMADLRAPDHPLVLSLRGLAFPHAPQAMQGAVVRAMRFTLNEAARPTHAPLPPPRPPREFDWRLLAVVLGLFAAIGVAGWLAGDQGVIAGAVSSLGKPGTASEGANPVRSSGPGQVDLARRAVTVGTGGDGERISGGPRGRLAPLTPDRQPGATITVVEAPQAGQWLELVAALVDAGQGEEAVAEWTRFRAAYPEAEAPAALQRRLKAMKACATNASAPPPCGERRREKR